MALAVRSGRSVIRVSSEVRTVSIEKAAGIVILVLNLAGLIFLVSAGIRALLKRHMARFDTVEIEDDDLFLTSDDLIEPPPTEKSPEPVKKQAPAKKPEFNLDDFDFDL